MYGYGFMLKLEGKRHGTFSWKIDTQITQHTSINELSARHRYVLKRLGVAAIMYTKAVNTT